MVMKGYNSQFHACCISGLVMGSCARLQWREPDWLTAVSVSSDHTRERAYQSLVIIGNGNDQIFDISYST